MCGQCEAAARLAAANNLQRTSSVSQTMVASGLSSEPCEYTDEIFEIWLTKLKWFKNKGVYVKYNIAASTVNQYLGLVLTSLNAYNKCVYASRFAEIEKVITLINGIQ